jgi:hypothetical protein
VPLLSSAKKAEEFAKLLEGSGSAGSGDLSTLQGLASRLSAVPQPRPQFASALRDRLMSDAATTLPSAAGAGAGSSGAGSSGAGSSGTGAAASTGSSATSAASTTGSAVSAGGSALSATAPLWTQLAAGAAATAIAVTGVGVGASRSLPGDLLYGVKRQAEGVQLDLAGGSTDVALTHLGFARARLDEMSGLLDDHAAGAPLSPELQKRIRTLLTEWAGETSRGTTVLLDQLSAGTSDADALRRKLIDFTDSQARGLTIVVQRLPDTTLQSLTGSAFAYLQRVDTALGNPVDLARLLPSLGLALPTTSTAATPAKPGTVPTTGSSAQPPATGGSPTGSTPTSVPTLPIPTGGHAVPRNTTPTTPSLPRLPTNGAGGNGGLPGKVGGAVGTTTGAVNGATSGAAKTVDGVLEGVTGNGPSLPLPTTVPTVPGVHR